MTPTPNRTQPTNTEGQVHARLYLALAVGTQILSLLDFIYTTVGLRLIPGSFEMNPFFGGILSTPWATLGLKFVLIPASLWLLYHFRRRPLARVGLWLCFLAYLAFDAFALYIVLTYWREVLG